MKRILFVDDEAAVLEGIANLFRKYRKVWKMEFAQGAEQALELLEQGQFDVVVTDMRMPRMDGAALLQHVKRLHPAATRIILSGHSEPDALARSLAVAHQFMSKPCSPEELYRLLEQSCSLQRGAAAARIRELVGAVDQLPSVPSTYLELNEAIAHPNTSAKDLARIIERDTAMSAKVLQLSSSAFFGARKPPTSVAQAVTFLGIEVLRGVALLTGVFAVATRVPRIPGFSLEALQLHAVETARYARELAPPELRDQAATTALIHDVGKIILAMGAPLQFMQALQLAETSGRPFHEAELELYDATHAEVGAYLLGMWGISGPIVDAVARHHDAPSDDAPLARIIQQASALADAHGARAPAARAMPA
ncbi:MAG: response regulator [Myxococcota bacterium]